MADILGAKLKPSDRLKLILMLASTLVTVIGAWYVLGARVGALEVADTVSIQRVQTIEAGSVSRDLRIESEQSQMRDVLVELQQGQAAMDAKLDILVGDRRNAP